MRGQMFEVCRAVSWTADEQHFVVGDCVERWEAREIAIGEGLRITFAELIEDERDLFGGEFFPGERILETASALEDQIGEVVDFAAAEKEVAGAVAAQAVRVADDHFVEFAGFEFGGFDEARF